ncbi:MAG: amidophosphoribosyltransferase [bacterium]|nr:amidophosphoribosyltransferase [bacterium]
MKSGGWLHLHNIVTYKKEQEMCGICGAFSQNTIPVDFMVKQAVKVNHRGHEAVGLAQVSCDGQFNHFVGQGLVRTACTASNPKFCEFCDRAREIAPTAYIGHTRYSTVGPSDLAHGQPIGMCHPKFGQFYVVHNGQIPRHEVLRKELEAQGQWFQTQSDTETLAAVIAHSEATTLAGAVYDLVERVDGAFSIIAISDQHLVAARDAHGFWPLWYGFDGNGGVVFASEEPALGRVYYRAEYIPAGTVVVSDKAGDEYGTKAQTVRRLERTHACWLNAVYLSRPDEGIGSTATMSNVRYALGGALADVCQVDVDMVVGVPDSGLDAMFGFAKKRGLSTEDWRAIVRNRFAPGRSFILPGQEDRQDVIRDKHSVTMRMVHGKRVGVVDDTIVRSNTARILTQMLYEAGAMEVHWFIPAPPIRFCCYYGIDTPTLRELAAHGRDEKQIAHMIGANSVTYLPLPVMLAVLERYNRYGWCTACVDGDYPIAVT